MSVDVRQYGILGALAVIIILFQILTGGKLLLPANINNLIQQNAYVLILAVGMIIVIIAGHIDLSVGSVVAVVGAITAIAITQWGLPWFAAVLIGLAAGAVIGIWQGFWIAYVGIPAFIVTLAGMLLFRGLTLVLLTGGTINALPDEFVAIGKGSLPQSMGTMLGGHDVVTMLIALVVVAAVIGSQLRTRARRKKLDLPVEPGAALIAKLAIVAIAVLAFAWLLSAHKGLPIILIILAVLIMLYTFILQRTVFGRNVYAMGGNLFAAKMSGVRTERVNFLIFVNMGVLAALAGIVTTARAGGAVASAGNTYELDAIAAAFIGGAAVTGGVGTVIGAVIGAMIMGVLNMGLSILSVDSAWQSVIKGLVLLLAVAIDVLGKRRGGRS
ncbi:sugar ABC transporter permease [Pseudoclavibacter sp. RFBJ3]|uniref:multiple monosaccharide ABC transporter permease n=1 Tax=unclassified Pseudoclavibacter TaxID=2615177 RepID=UPI000CE91BFB|nr:MULTISPECIES: multiple monosaccharide ABC transporter permease [unclassified Pseudoclavibacter]MBF4551263.1 sugar ABC transporter permease [Pseudoclavibacter sp. VKM Ac-2888]PPF33212.1 sugar ABC transporter permease [Pseudoclavibacter sp. AY1H1]PPF74055.1 sugar ABC transporter permease [Pseudoclavibacter sp. Z016]PPF81786.1 sugar ABC transporter permease [Pseudoclavibacter sp. RFBJ5]PPF91129.1 sugar ABC transporter permease [Pseudoclavibacter sp. RFBJ3]